MSDTRTISELLYTAAVVQLDGLDFARQFTRDEIAAAYNGIGADWMGEELRKKLTDLLALFAPAAMIHDLRYTKSDGARFGFNYANIEFHNNCLKLARWAYPWWRLIRRWVAENAALALYKAVSSEGGWKAWTDAAQKNGAHIEGAEISQNLHENSDASKLPANTETAQT